MPVAVLPATNVLRKNSSGLVELLKDSICWLAASGMMTSLFWSISAVLFLKLTCKYKDSPVQAFNG